MEDGFEMVMEEDSLKGQIRDLKVRIEEQDEAIRSLELVFESLSASLSAPLSSKRRRDNWQFLYKKNNSGRGGKRQR